MKDLEGWFARQARREKRVILLEDALLSNRFWSYAFYRLRYFLLRYLAGACVHGIKFLLLFHIFSRQTFIALLLAHAGVSFLSSFWWGVLETMRARVRLLYRSGKPHLIAGEVSRWLTLSILLCILTLIGAAGWIFWILFYARQAFTPGHLYGLAILFGFALQTVVRTFHSGVYAIRRIYRPVWTILAVEFVGLAAVFALWPALGLWSFPFSAILSSMTIAGLTIHYTLRLYRFFDFVPLKIFDLAKFRLSSYGPSREAAAAGLAYALMKMDSVLVLALFGGQGSAGNAVELFVLFFIISPTIEVGFDWAQLFYFDLKRLELGLFKNLRRRYEQAVGRLAWFVGALSWLLGCLTGTLIYQRSLGELYWLLAPFFVSRSLLASLQIQAFSDRRYGELLKSAFVWLAGLLAVSVVFEGEREKVAVLSAVTFFAFVLLRRRQGPIWASSADPEPVGLGEWLAEVSAVTEPVRIRSLQLSPAPDTLGDGRIRDRDRAERWIQRQVAEGIARRLHGAGAVAAVGPRGIAWYERADTRVRIQDAWLISIGGGLVNLVADTGVRNSGALALQVARRQNLLGRRIGARLGDGSRSMTADDLARSFARLFPQGVIFSPDRPVPPFFNTVSSKERRAILSDAIRFARGLPQSEQSSPFDVTAFCPSGELGTIFLLDRRLSRRARSSWSELVTSCNLQAAIEGTGPEQNLENGVPGLAP